MIKICSRRKILVITIVSCILTLSVIGAKLRVIETVQTVLQGEKLEKSNRMNVYNIAADFDPVERIITAKEKITYRNDENISFNALYFHLYPNAFKHEDTTPFEKNEMEHAYPKGFEPGYIDIHSIQENGEALNYVVMGIGESILKVHLNKSLEPGKKIDLNIDFSVKVPPSCGRFGYGENTINIANWYPILSVFDWKGWNLDPYYAIGDPFYSDVANYRVEILMPQEYILAYSGDCIKKESIEGKIRWTIEGEKIRDFAMIASDKFKMVDGEIDGIKIHSYYFDGQFGDLALDTAKDSIKIFSNLYGKYPYKQFSVVASDFFIGGMEYPNLVFIDQSLYKEENKQILEYVIAHEAAHQWWYGIVGNDEVNEPWLDEALTEYSTLLYYEKKYNAETRDEIYKNLILRYYNAYIEGKNLKEYHVCRSINKFEDSQEYQVLVYYRGAMFIKDLRKQLGDELFFQAMKVYFDKYKYKNANTEDFIHVCEKVANRDLRGSFKQWLRYEKE
ncbi:M1 family metallopeptidase [Marinisporobacter balticus]|uniref:Peptidase M1-like protein n=1 Tax=Marinisporobacter balticus TaxID=2018667 RepID=A0A4R2L2G3_9FIRM|nr:M1 family metallopeptidase [Marinisporobacter balticus]TCO77946.1 peptidase M1-like protein [Marinisporobacter balticus]